jgi:hypothetical protein
VEPALTPGVIDVPVTVSGVDVTVDPGTAGVDKCPVLVSVTGQMVVETAMVLVTTVVESAGQSVTVAAQLVMVTRLVE